MFGMNGKSLSSCERCASGDESAPPESSPLSSRGRRRARRGALTERGRVGVFRLAKPPSDEDRHDDDNRDTERTPLRTNRSAGEPVGTGEGSREEMRRGSGTAVRRTVKERLTPIIGRVKP